MTTPYHVNRDIRMVSAGLAANEAITLPGVITATGREAPSQWAVVPANIPVSFALLAGVDYNDEPNQRPGGGFIGGRNSSIVPDLPPSALAAPLNLQVTLRRAPTSRAEILSRLRHDTGFHWAPGAMFTLAGWEDGWLAVWLDHWRLNGADAKLSIALGQAMLAVRKMWLRVVWNVGVTSSSTSGSLIAECGAVAVGRALLDTIALLFRVWEEESRKAPVEPPPAILLCKINLLIRDFVRLLQKADRATCRTAKSKLTKAIDRARALLKAVALFSVADEPLNIRWKRMGNALPAMSVAGATPLLHSDLAAFDAALNRLAGAALGRRLERTVWRNHIRRSLLRFTIPDQAYRLALIDRVRGDLIYRLAMSRRLDRLYALFPWLAASHPAFVGCALGALGAYASLLECGRRMQIANDQKRRLGDRVDGVLTPSHAAALRLTIPSARVIWASQVKMAAAAGHGYAAGIALDVNAISHASMGALFAGAYFGPQHPITEARFGRLGWSFPAALTDPRTVATVQSVEKSRSVMQLRDHDDDLVRHQGMTVKRLVAATVVSVFPNHAPRADFRNQAIEAAEKAGRKVTNTGQTTIAATQELVRSMLLTLNISPAMYPRLRDGIADNKVPPGSLTGESLRAEKLRSKPTRKSVKRSGAEHGQGVRKDAANEPTVADGRGERLRALTEDVARWRTPRSPSAPDLAFNCEMRRKPKPPKYDGPPRDDELEDILRGRRDLDQIAPVGALALPVLWCAPMVDTKRIGWMANGAPLSANLLGSYAKRHAVSVKVAEAHAWASLLFAKSLPTSRSIAVACHLFTGCSPVTDDLDHT